MNANYYICECHCGVLHIEYEPDMGLQIALFERNVSRSWRNRIRLAWNAIKGRPYADMVLLNNQQIADLADQLIEIQNRKDYTL